jgi:hypothetical protein
VKVQIEKMKEDINEKRVQMRMLEQKIKTSPTPHLSLVPVDTSQVCKCSIFSLGSP